MSKKHTISTIFPNERFLIAEKDGEESYFCTFGSAEDACDHFDMKEGLVATYKLVKVEKLKLVRLTNVVKVK